MAPPRAVGRSGRFPALRAPLLASKPSLRSLQPPLTCTEPRFMLPESGEMGLSMRKASCGQLHVLDESRILRRPDLDLEDVESLGIDSIGSVPVFRIRDLGLDLDDSQAAAVGAGQDGAAAPAELTVSGGCDISHDERSPSLERGISWPRRKNARPDSR